MTEPSLYRPRIVPLVGEGIAAGMAEHVRVRLQFEAKTSAGGPLDHPGEACGRERQATAGFRAVAAAVPAARRQGADG